MVVVLIVILPNQMGHGSKNNCHSLHNSVMKEKQTSFYGCGYYQDRIHRCEERE